MKKIFLLALFLPQLGFACSWEVDPRGGKSYMERLDGMIKEANYIFLGEVKSYEFKLNPAKKHQWSWHYHEIETSTQYKGKVEPRIQYWPINSCGKTFTNIGSKYIFFGYDGGIEGIQFSELGGTITEEYATKNGIVEILEKLKAKQKKLNHNKAETIPPLPPIPTESKETIKQINPDEPIKLSS